MNKPNGFTKRIKKVVLHPASKSITETFHLMPDAVDDFFAVGLFGFGFTAVGLHGKGLCVSAVRHRKLSHGVVPGLSPALGGRRSGSSR